MVKGSGTGKIPATAFCPSVIKKHILFMRILKTIPFGRLF